MFFCAVSGDFTRNNFLKCMQEGVMANSFNGDWPWMSRQHVYTVATSKV